MGSSNYPQPRIVGVSDTGELPEDAVEVHVVRVPAEQVTDETAPACEVSHCRAIATHTPVLRIALMGHDHVSHVALPTRVCFEHRDQFAERFLTPARRANMEASLHAHGRDAPDWARTYIVFATG